MEVNTNIDVIESALKLLKKGTYTLEEFQEEINTLEDDE